MKKTDSEKIDSANTHGDEAGRRPPPDATSARPGAPAREGGSNPAGEANEPRDGTQAAHRSGQFGADKPAFGKAATPKRQADDQPHPKGPEYEEGGRYPGTREPGS